MKCACGCGTEIPATDSRGRPRSYVRGHTNRGRSNTWLVKPDREINRFTARERARKVLGPGPCFLERIGGCEGTIEVHHVDGDPWHNVRPNLRRLCRSHHRLVHSGRINLRRPVMPPFTVSSGKRRYGRGSS